MNVICGNEKKNIIKTLKHVKRIAEKANARCNCIKKYDKKIKYIMYTGAPYKECKVLI